MVCSWRIGIFPSLKSRCCVFCSPFPMLGEHFDGQVSVSSIQRWEIGTSRARDMRLLPSDS